jgi:hypothetical protein
MVENTYLLQYGQGWRRLARGGAVLAAAATFLPISDHWYTLWHDHKNLLAAAMGEDPGALLLDPRVVFCCLGAPAMLSGIWHLFMTSPRLLWSPSYRLIVLALAFLLWLLTVVTPVYFASRHAEVEEFNAEMKHMLVISALIYLLVNGLFLMQSWHNRGTPLVAFPLGVTPLITALAAWLTALISILHETPLDTRLLYTFGLGTLAALVMLTGWVCWWVAVRAGFIEDQWYIEQLRARRPSKSERPSKQARGRGQRPEFRSQRPTRR